MAFSPDGHHYAFDAGGGIWVGATRTGRTRRIVADGTDPAWSPDSRHIAYLSTRDHHGSHAVHESADQTAREAYVVDGDGRHPRRMTSTTQDETPPLIWTHDGQTLLASRTTLTGATTLALDLTRHCRQPLALDLPLEGDPSAWDSTGTAAVLRATC